MAVYCFDIDGTICTNTNGEYEKACSYKEIIEKINNLYNSGHVIIYFTARGYTTKIDWYEFTKNQLNEWNAKYHRLLVGKPFADYYIDDKGVSAKDFFKLI